MAGNHIYLEPILDQATGGLNDIVVNINDNVTAQINKLEEVANILTNILSNTGISITQKAFNGADLARTIHKFSNDILFEYDLGTGTETIRSQPGYTPDIIGHDLKYYAGYSVFRNVANGFQFTRDLTECDNLHVDIFVSNVNILTVQIYIDDVQVRNVTNANLDIDLSEYTGLHTIKFTTFAANQTSNYGTIEIKNLNLDGNYIINNGQATIDNNMIAKSSDVLADMGFSCAVEFATALTDVNLWSQLIVQGSEIDNLKVYILNDRFQIYKEINRSTDLSDLDLYSNFYVGFVAGNSTLISNVIFRYS